MVFKSQLKKMRQKKLEEQQALELQNMNSNIGLPQNQIENPVSQQMGVLSQ